MLVCSIVYSLVLFACTTILLLSIFCTVVPDAAPDNPRSERFAILTLASEESRAYLLSGILCFLVILILLFWLSHKSNGVCRRGRMFLIVGIAFATCIQVALILKADTSAYLWGDSNFLFSYAHQALQSHPDNPILAIREGYLQDMETGITSHAQSISAYLTCYPFNTGIFLYYLAAIRVAGQLAHKLIQAVNTVANVLSMLCILWLTTKNRTQEESDDDTSFSWMPILLALLIPLWMQCVYSYGNQVGFASALAFLVFEVHIHDAKGLRLALFSMGALVALATALTFKSTFVLIAIAAILAWCVMALLYRNRYAVTRLILTLIIVFVAREVSAMPQRFVAKQTGIPLDRPMTMYNHLEVGFHSEEDMGITVSVDGRPHHPARGWYSPIAVANWLEAEGDAVQQQVLATRSLAQGINETADGRGILRFFAFKTASEWCAPDFQGFFYLAQCQDESGNLTTPLQPTSRYFTASKMLLVLLNGMQSVVYLGVLLYLLLHRPSAHTSSTGSSTTGFTTLLLMCAAFCGLGCYLLWEAKGVYVLPYYVLFIPFAINGLHESFSFIKCFARRTPHQIAHKAKNEHLRSSCN